MQKKLMNFDRFKKIMQIIMDFDEKREVVSKFVETQLATDSWVNLTYGNELQDTLIYMLADEFDCWYWTVPDGFCNMKIDEDEDGAQMPPPKKLSKEEYLEYEKNLKDWWECPKFPQKDNDICYWLYDAPDDKTITTNSTTYSINTLEEFYNYLVDSYNEKHKSDLQDLFN